MNHLIEKSRIYNPETLGLDRSEVYISLLNVLQIIEAEFQERLQELESTRKRPLKVKDVELQNQMPAPAYRPLVVRSYVFKRDKKGGFEIRIFVHSQNKNNESRIAKATYILKAAESLT